MTIHFHPEPHTSPPKIHYFRQDTVPGTGDGLVVGDLWSDTTAGLLKRCTSISPVTFVSTEGGSSAHDLGSATHGDVNDAAAPTKGSLLVGNGTSWVEVGVGTDGQQFEADSAQASGVKWAAAGGAGEFGDDVFRVTDDVDATKKIAFQASGITTGNVRTLTVPDKSFTIADNADLHNQAHSDADHTHRAFAIKSADQTVNNSTTLVNAADMSFSVGANEVWVFMLIVMSNSSSVADIKFDLSVPTAATKRWSTTGNQNLLTGSFKINGSGVDRKGTIEGVVLVGANAGTVQLQFAQDVAEVSDTKLLKDSFLVAWRIS